ncbi:MAG: polyphosphate:AMP phosphotransferase [Clostridiales bacterium]|nr:polyphosphate:AMP phosphotransferase [Clostridiales bacterium]MBR5359033.1 polyphosphate:AMP phosphotransferase [Clostridiales bacterium]
MLEDYVKAMRPEDEELAAGIKDAREALNACQMKIKEAGLPVMVIFEGWGAAGKGSVLGKVIRNIDPRFFKVKTYAAPTEEEKRYPFLYRYIKDIPEKGKFTFYDTYWMEEITDARMDGSMSDAEYEERIDSINRTERTLVDNGYLVMKFFFHIGKKEQKKRLDELLADKDTKWRVDKSDLYENKHYDESLKVYDNYLKDTNSPTAPWYIIDAKDKKFAELQVLEFLNSGIDTALKNKDLAVPILQNTYKLKKTPKLKEIELKGKTLTEEEYDQRLDELQKELRQLHYKLYRKKIPVIIAYEGWDAAGKGGNIKRITGALDPRGFEVLPIASPEPHEKARHFLWRFWTRLPKTGHIAIFDRTWYGRVMVERIEGFCSENDWQRAYNEINEFEKELSDWGAVVIKFWVQIDKRTQLKRFKERQATPEKQWKITDEDWRNREKWNQYEGAIDEMIQKTSTEFAPWYILESVDKKYARIKALEIVIDRIKKACD